MAKQVLETPRLILREMLMDDLDFVAVMLADPKVMRYYPKCYTRDEAAAWVQRSMDRYARHGHGLWLVSDKATGQAVVRSAWSRRPSVAWKSGKSAISFTGHTGGRALPQKPQPLAETMPCKSSVASG